MITIQGCRDSEMALRVHSVQAGMSVAYLIEGDAGLLLIDAGTSGHEQRIFKKMRQIGRADLRAIFITHAHFDHYGCAAAIRRHTGAPIAIHAADSEALAQGETRLGEVRSWGILGKWLLPLGLRLWPVEPTLPDMVCEDGETLKEFGFDARVIHTPGHTPGSSSLLVNENLVCVGDLLSSRPWLFMQRYYAHDWDQVRASVRRIIDINAQWVCPGHGRPVRGEKLRHVLPRHSNKSLL